MGGCDAIINSLANFSLTLNSLENLWKKDERYCLGSISFQFQKRNILLLEMNVL